jgi:hypothetical protein
MELFRAYTLFNRLLGLITFVARTLVQVFYGLSCLWRPLRTDRNLQLAPEPMVLLPKVRVVGR